MTAAMRFEPILEEASDWVDAVAGELRRVPEAIRLCSVARDAPCPANSLDMELAVRLGEELPILIRGLYYEGWAARKGPPHILGSVDFLESMRGALRGHGEFRTW